MKKFLPLIFLCFILIEMLIQSIYVIESVNFAFNICFNSLFPTLFPFFILSNLLIEYGFVELASIILSPIMTKVFKIKCEGSYVLILSIISGSPGNAKYIKQLYDKKIINSFEAEKLLTFTHFTNPLFIIGTIGLLFFNDKRIGLIILISHYIGNIIIGLLFRNYHPSIDNSSHNIKLNISSNKSFMIILTESIYSTIKTLLLILGIITSTLVFITIIKNQFNIDNILINGLLEITQGLKMVSSSKINLSHKIILSTFFVSFGGFSVHMQVKSILNDKKIRYTPYLIARIIHGLVSSIVVAILYYIFIN